MIKTITTSRGEIVLDLDKFVSGTIVGWMDPIEFFPYSNQSVIITIYNAIDGKQWVKVYDCNSDKFLGEYLINEREDCNI